MTRIPRRRRRRTPRRRTDQDTNSHRPGHELPGESRSGEEEVEDTKQEDQGTEQTEELVPIQRLTIVIQNSWWHWSYEHKWRQCDGCRTWCMLFCNFPKTHTAMRQHPVTTVAERVRSVSKRDSKHMCKACNTHKFLYDGEHDSVYVLRQWGHIMHAITGKPFWISHDITRVTMNVASFFLPIGPEQLQIFRDSRDGVRSNRVKNSEVKIEQ